MNLINKYRIVIVILVPLLILILFRLLSPGFFKVNARKWAEPSFQRSNLVTGEKLKFLEGEKLIINLGGELIKPSGIEEEAVTIAPGSILSSINLIKEHKGPVILFSSESSVSARIWMLLSQMGYKNIYILAGDEVLKYKFRPDSLTRPEL